MNRNMSYDVCTARADGLFVAIDKMKLQNNQSNDGDTTTTTPSTSASSSPSLPPSTPTNDVPPLTNASRSSSTENGFDATSQESAWVAPPSKKSLRTHNPIRAIVDPIMANSIKCGKERGDGKDQISLAVSILIAARMIV